MSKPLTTHDIEYPIRLVLSLGITLGVGTGERNNILQGIVYLSRNSRLSDLLNDHRNFIPVKVNGEIKLVNKAHIVLVEEI